MSNIIDVLQERGFIEALTHEEIKNIANKPFTVYCGFDPTGDSLHVGHMVALMGLAWFQRYGHKPIALVGGATGMIGDPSGKSQERQLLDEQSLVENVKGITKNLETLLDFSKEQTLPLILNNFTWFKEFSFIGFLRDIGKYFRVGTMLAKESVKNRMTSEEGMSFTEFSYQLLQGYDFLYLNDHFDVSVQIGGSDQWGNITAGIELVRKMRAKSVFGITFPLLTRSDGQKFGKSEKGAVWLSPDKCSPYEFYQYFIRVPDADVIKLMRLLTFMDMKEIRDYEKQMSDTDYVPNTSQKRLAEEITRLVHGEEGLQVALKVTLGASPGSETKLDGKTLEAISHDMTSYDISLKDLIGKKIIDLMTLVALQKSKSEARRLILNGGAYLNNEKIVDENEIIDAARLIEGRLLLLSAGKKNKILIRVTDFC